MDATFRKKKNPLIPSDFESETDASDFEDAFQNQERQIKVFDRYQMILQIFARRSKSRLAKAEIELSFIQFLK